jgi:hypothetical protein
MGTLNLRTNAGGSVIFEPQNTATDRTVLVPATSGTMATTSQLTGFRNRIMNGDMRIDQYNNGASGAASTARFAVDRWRGYIGGGGAGAFSVQQSNVVPPGFDKSIAATVTTSGTPGESGILQYIEGYNVADLMYGTANAKTITISFWVRSSVTGNFPFVLRTTNGVRSYLTTYNISAANTWEYKTITIPGETTGVINNTSDYAFIFQFAFGGSNGTTSTTNTWLSSNAYNLTGSTSLLSTNGATFYVTGVQLEEGTVATPFERREYGTELAMCQRYYEYGMASGSGYAQVTSFFDAGSTSNIDFKVSKRVVPTLTNMSLSGNQYPNNQGNSVPRYENGFSRGFRYTTVNNTTFWNVTTGLGGSTGVAGHQIIWNAQAEF